MSARTNDIVFVFNGGDAFARTRKLSDDFDLSQYNAKCKTLPAPRQLLGESRGVDEDVGANVDVLINRIRVFTKNQLDTIGQVCLLGRSAGCHLALLLAAELNDLGVKELTFVGVSDVPMWDIGRQPPIRKIGAFRPVNGPTEAGMHRSLAGARPLNPSDPKTNSVPHVKLDQTIDARKKVSLYQVLGNHTKYASSVKRWIWKSDLSDGEVHGTVAGFENRRFTVSGNFVIDVDLSYHVNLNTGGPWKGMCQEAATAFAAIT